MPSHPPTDAHSISQRRQHWAPLATTQLPFFSLFVLAHAHGHVRSWFHGRVAYTVGTQVHVCAQVMAGLLLLSVLFLFPNTRNINPS